MDSAHLFASKSAAAAAARLINRQYLAAPRSVVPAGAFDCTERLVPLVLFEGGWGFWSSPDVLRWAKLAGVELPPASRLDSSSYVDPVRGSVVDVRVHESDAKSADFGARDDA